MLKLLNSSKGRFTGMPLALEIALVLAVKVAVIFALRQAFFANPQAKKMVVPAQQVEQHFFSDTRARDSEAGARKVSHPPSAVKTEEPHGAD
ncbi:MAG: hypothetical protein H6R01_1541 [Burkholderiaceae bacterium]|nr:hypothetical protein [Burkholderiaceae bacterium]